MSEMKMQTIADPTKGFKSVSAGSFEDLNMKPSVSEGVTKKNVELLQAYMTFGSTEQKEYAKKQWQKEMVWVDAAANLLEARADVKYEMGGDGMEEAFALADLLKKRYKDKFLDGILTDAFALTGNLQELHNPTQYGEKASALKTAKFVLGTKQMLGSKFETTP